ncbi:3-oxoacyl-ACP synthase III family protein [Streptomyces sp. NPDC002698]|uniref:3-oxoacyl-ACP synthase III family protein n=1 Tax=Streptomyces sp. NPDC002698 TaxID=3364660 RepID=UPI00367DD941
MNACSQITQVAVHLPEGRQTCEAIEDRLREHSPALRIPAGLLRRMYGLEERLVADDGVLPSDLASRAALQVLAQAGLEPGDIDLLLFASVSADVQEPANAHIVAAKTGLTCPVFDVSNACNSVLNALEVADALIVCGRYRRVLVACGETLSRLSRWKMTSRHEMRTALASMTGGDMGAALLVEAGTEPGIIASTFMANSTGWPAATLFNPYQAPGLPRGLDIDSEQLLASFLGLDARAVQWLKENDTDPGELSLVCVHQPSVPFVRTFSERLGVRPETVVPTFSRTGNVAAATLPLQLALACEQDRLRSGTKIALFGLASGASAGVMLIDWTTQPDLSPCVFAAQGLQRTR